MKILGYLCHGQGDLGQKEIAVRIPAGLDPAQLGALTERLGSPVYTVTEEGAIQPITLDGTDILAQADGLRSKWRESAAGV